VTQQEYEKLMARNSSQFSRRNGGQHPVEVVNWQDAVDFCNKLSVQEGLKPYYDSGTREVLDGNGYRLPTEAEWEYACRAGTTTRWSFGDDETDLPRYAWVDSNSEGRTHPVGELGANPFGLHDMHGNVWEWCRDWHDEYAAAAADDPRGPADGKRRVLRGGAFIYLPRVTRCAFRNHYVPTYRFSDFGFRVARLAVAR
jgi:formylglycine-generating enzyme required for sulfatase activity